MKRILIVEDDKVVAAGYKQRFTSAGFTVDLAPDGLEGIRQSTAGKPDVVLLDLLMPRLDGLEVLKYIRGHPDLSDLPVVVFSNSYMTNMIESAWRAGANQCLMKASTTPTQVIEVVNKGLERCGSSIIGPSKTSALRACGQPACRQDRLVRKTS
jgi:CheY-like chemotaxis protein